MHASFLPNGRREKWIERKLQFVHLRFFNRYFLYFGVQSTFHLTIQAFIIQTRIASSKFKIDQLSTFSFDWSSHKFKWNIVVKLCRINIYEGVVVFSEWDIITSFWQYCQTSLLTMFCLCKNGISHLMAKVVLFPFYIN